MPDRSVLSRPYPERQMIVVSDERFIAAAEEESRKVKTAEKPDRFDWLAFTARVGRKALTFNPAGMMIDIGLEAFKAWSKARENGLPILAISKQQSHDLAFPPGHPLETVVYIGHPTLPKVYYTLADFHRRVFEHKVSEAISLLMSLGATNIRAEHVSGWSRDFSAKLSLSVSGMDSNIGGKAGKQDKTRNSLLFVATLAGSDAPALPEGLMWYPHEPAWQNIADGRLKHGLRNFSLSVTYSDDFGINLGIKASVVKSGLDVGGTFEGHESTVWKLTGQFGSSNGIGGSLGAPRETALKNVRQGQEMAHIPSAKTRSHRAKSNGSIVSDPGPNP
jgi:hypothetical protein